MTQENIFDRIVREAGPNPNPTTKRTRYIPNEPELISDTLRYALQNDPRTIYEIAKQMRIEPDSLYKFKQGYDLRLDTADKLAAALGFELKPIKRKRSKATK